MKLIDFAKVNNIIKPTKNPSAMTNVIEYSLEHQNTVKAE